MSGPPPLLRAGVNTGSCITGDADCDGNASSAGPTLIAADGTALDNPAMDRGEFAVLMLDFGKDNRRVYVPSESNPALAVVGVPSSTTAGVENLGVARVARVSGNPRNNFGAPIPGVTVSVYNYVSGSSTAVGPTRDKPHLELAIRGYSRIPVELAALDATNSVMAWDPTVACIAVAANLGSIDDGPVGEDSMVEQQNCPTASPSPSAARSAPLSASVSASATTTASTTASPTQSVNTRPPLIQFTGRVDVDFPAGPGVFVATDGVNDVFFPHNMIPTDPYSPSVIDPTGCNIMDVRFAYDYDTDTAYFGKDSCSVA